MKGKEKKEKNYREIRLEKLLRRIERKNCLKGWRGKLFRKMERENC